MIKKMNNRWGLLFYLSIFFLSILISFYCHKKSGYFNWKSDIWADKAGYYIYLPSFFMYHFDASKCPEKIDEKTGYGFTVDKENNKIITKYTYGVAALVAPFFVLARIVSPVFHIPGDAGFGTMFHWMVNLAAVFYLVLGLFFLKKFLAYYFKSFVSYILLILVYAGTNLLYYTVNEALMSHVYSFFLFSVFLFSMKRYLDTKAGWKYFILMSFAFALIVLIRPTNGILLVLFFLWDCLTREDIYQRVRLFFKPERIASFLFILFLIFLPQMIYWKYSRGSFIFWSYTNEGFSNWTHPKILEQWFSTLNGLFLYSPLVFLMIVGMFIMIIRKIPNGWLTLVLFIAISYIFSSWYNWYYGCSFGQRSFVEYYSVLIVPFGFFILEIPKIRNLLWKNLLILLTVALSYYSVKMTLEFDEKCFFGSTWDWVQFKRQLSKAHIFISYEKKFSFQNDFENVALSYPFVISDSIHRSGMYSARILPEKEYTAFYFIPMNNLAEKLPHYIQVDFWAFNPGGKKIEASVVCAMDINDSNIVWQSQPLPPMTGEVPSWQKIHSRFVIPDGMSREPLIKIYIWNPKKDYFFADDLTVDFE
jgi:hypothetical protein